jgi:hypothetical protein
MLTEHDELRHLSDEDFFWRESLYFNFDDEVNGLGAWIYLWVVPNQPQPSGMLVSIYKGEWPQLDINDVAMSSPGHRVGDADRWIYCFKHNVDHLIEEDFDDVALCGLHLRRTSPLHRYEIHFNDSEGTTLDLDVRFTTPPYDYATGVGDSPAWIAANRYHRAWRGNGSLVVAGRTYQLNVTGDSDHSWGTRDNGTFAQHRFKMWSFQSPDGEIAVSAVQLEDPVSGDRRDLGFVDRAGRMASIVTINSEASFDALAVQSKLQVRIVDELGRETHASMDKMHSHLGSGGTERLWGWEGVGIFSVEGQQLPGLVSYFWPPSEAPALLTGGSP